MNSLQIDASNSSIKVQLDNAQEIDMEYVILYGQEVIVQQLWMKYISDLICPKGLGGIDRQLEDSLILEESEDLSEDQEMQLREWLQQNICKEEQDQLVSLESSTKELQEKITQKLKKKEEQQVPMVQLKQKENEVQKQLNECNKKKSDVIQEIKSKIELIEQSSVQQLIQIRKEYQKIKQNIKNLDDLIEFNETTKKSVKDQLKSQEIEGERYRIFYQKMQSSEIIKKLVKDRLNNETINVQNIDIAKQKLNEFLENQNLTLEKQNAKLQEKELELEDLKINITQSKESYLKQEQDIEQYKDLIVKAIEQAQLDQKLFHVVLDNRNHLEKTCNSIENENLRLQEKIESLKPKSFRPPKKEKSWAHLIILDLWIPLLIVLIGIFGYNFI